jgi:hypothetical protein
VRGWNRFGHLSADPACAIRCAFVRAKQSIRATESRKRTTSEQQGSAAGDRLMQGPRDQGGASVRSGGRGKQTATKGLLR